MVQVSATEAFDTFVGCTMAYGLFAWLVYLYAEAQETAYAYRLRVVTRRRA